MRLLDDYFFAKVLQKNYAGALEVKSGINMLFLIHLIFLSAFGLIAGIAGLDILTNTPPEIGIFSAGVILESLAIASCLVVIRTRQVQILLLCFITGIWASSLVFFGYFSALPGRFAWHYLIAEPADSWNLVSNYFRASFAWAWVGVTATLYVLIYAAVRRSPAPEKRIPLSWVVPAALLLTGVTLNGFRTNPGKGSPGLDFSFSLVRSLYDLTIYSKNGLVRLQPRISMAQMPPIQKPMPFSVLLILHESLRSDRLSIYGYEKETTPNLAKWLESLHGTTHEIFQFQKAFSNATYTHISYPSLLTGVHPLEGMEALHIRPIIFDHIKRFVNPRTAVISSQSYQSGNYAAFINTPSLDHLVYRESEGWKAWNNIGADDSNLPIALSKFLDSSNSKNFFAILHHNATHFPYRTPDSVPPW
jgi:glucan phosphoethanolaminetransferase (alkaline phosphatase superfamily)